VKKKHRTSLSSLSKKPQGGQTKQLPRPKRIHRRFARTFASIWAIVGFLSVVGGLMGYFALLPRLEISLPASSATVYDPLGCPVTLSNKGYLSIYPETVSLYVKDWRNEGGGQQSGYSAEYRGAQLLKPGDSADFVPEPRFAMPAKPIFADFLVIVQYRYWQWPWALEKRTRFRAERGADDHWRWSNPFMTKLDRIGRPRTILPSQWKQE